MLLLVAAAAAQPSPEALKLGRQLAEGGFLASVLPTLQMKETEEIIAAHPELSGNEKAALRVTSQRVYETGREKLMQAEAESYARRMTLDDLRAVAAFQGSAAGKSYAETRSEVVEDVMPVIGKMDFKGDVAAAFCKETGKLCAK